MYGLSSCAWVQRVIRPAVRDNAPSIIVVHNHPSGDPTPSPEDVSITRELVAAGKLMGVELLDHLVIGSGNRLGALLVDMETGLRGFLIAGQDAFLEPLEKELKQSLDRLEEVQDLAELRGVEGAASRAYFSLFRRWNRSGMLFERRSKRGATDPVNVLLNFGYSLLTRELEGLLEAAGLP